MRRVFAAACLVVLSGPLQAQSYPEKLIKMIVPAPPGGQTDVLARFRGQRLQTALGQNVIVDNRAGAGGAIGARAAATSEADGYTIFFGNTSTLAVRPRMSVRGRGSRTMAQTTTSDSSPVTRKPM